MKNVRDDTLIDYSIIVTELVERLFILIIPYNIRSTTYKRSFTTVIYKQ